MKKKAFVMLALVLVLVLAVTVGCATTSTTGAQTSAASGKTYKWVAQSPWPDGTILHWMATEIAKDITKASGGRLTVEMHPVGTVVGALDLLDAVHNGSLDAIHSWEGYWMGKIPAAGFFAAMPLGMNEQEYMTWVLEDEGGKLWQEIFKDYNVKVLPAGCYTPEIMYQSKVPIRNLEDLKGKKVRGVAFWGQIQSKLGASVVTVAGNEIYQALERGVVDAIEYATPASNYPLGYHEVAPYLVTPGIHQPTSTFSFMVNKKKWDELPDDLKRIVEICTQNMWGKAWAHAAAEDAKVWQEYKKLEQAGKIKIIQFDPKDQVKIKQMANELYAETAAKDPVFKKVFDSQNKFLSVYNPWRKAMEPSY
ncbi:MAG: TRAP transporter substrate-binding protein DctP [Firmicutes bacterium]|nr:TRAP transporter substrate-binding protein DctP [Bacillota bacterium]